MRRRIRLQAGERRDPSHWPAGLQMRRRAAQDCCWVLMLLAAAPTPAPANAVGGASCSVSATSLAFGNYVPASSSPTDFTATITVTCTASGVTPAAIAGTVNLMGSAGQAGRYLTGGPQQLRYQLYRDPARSIPWGDGGGGAGAAAISGFVGPATPFRQASGSTPADPIAMRRMAGNGAQRKKMRAIPAFRCCPIADLHTAQTGGLQG
jgi:spore coat protein U-like protein